MLLFNVVYYLWLPLTSESVKEKTSKYELLTNISKFIKTSWPTEIKNQIVKAFYNHSSALSQSESITMLSDRIVIPFSLKTIILKQLHTGHSGIVRMKALARSHILAKYRSAINQWGILNLYNECAQMMTNVFLIGLQYK